MEMFGARKKDPSPYASRRDFRQIFERDMNRLYLLSLLLTGDEALGERCFISSLQIAQSENRVFKDWAESWVRRTIILNAIHMTRPRLTSEDTAGVRGTGADDALMERDEIAAILALPAFERFVFVMSVLEGYSDQECSLHLSCTRGDVMAARARALERMGRFAELHGKLISVASGRKAPRGNSNADPRLETISGLAASA